MPSRSLKTMKEELFVALLEGLVNGIITFMVAWAFIGFDPASLKMAGLFGTLRFVSSMRELDWVSIQLGELPGTGQEKLGKKQVLIRSITNIGRFI